MKLRKQRVPDGLTSSWVARAWRGDGAEASHAIGVAEFMVNTQGEGTAAAVTERARIESVGSRLNRWGRGGGARHRRG